MENRGTIHYKEHFMKDGVIILLKKRNHFTKYHIKFPFSIEKLTYVKSALFSSQIHEYIHYVNENNCIYKKKTMFLCNIVYFKITLNLYFIDFTINQI